MGREIQFRISVIVFGALPIALMVLVLFVK